jgi:hypothetical protein
VVVVLVVEVSSSLAEDVLVVEVSFSTDDVDIVVVDSVDRHTPERCPEYDIEQHLLLESYVYADFGIGIVLIQRPSSYFGFLSEYHLLAVGLDCNEHEIIG